MRLTNLDSDFLRYLIEHDIEVHDKLPTLTNISKEMGISVGKLREQLEHARTLGLVSVKPRVGTRRQPFDFGTVVLPGLLFALASGEVTFAQLSELRRGIEMTFWDQAVRRLLPEDLDRMQQLLSDARAKLNGSRIQIPHIEHRAFHLTIFGRIDNPLILGLLTAYWDAYDAVELTRYQSYAYWQEVWGYHERIADAIAGQRFDEGRQILIDHFNLLTTTPASVSAEANGR